MVGFDLPIKVLSMHIQKPYKGKNSPIAVISSKNIFLDQTSCICSICLHVLAKYQIAPSKAVVGVDPPMKALSMHIQKMY